jgi:hypothetical protein
MFFCKSLMNVSPFRAQTLVLLSGVCQLVDSNSGIYVCIVINPTMGKTGYMHEVLARLLFIHGVWSILKLYDVKIKR